VAFPPTAAAPLSVCLQLTHAINRTARLEEIFEAALDALESGLSVEKSAILLFDPDGVMRFKAWRRLSEGYRRAVEGHTPWKAGMKGAEPLVVADVTEDAGLTAFLPVIRAERISGMVFVPLEDADGIIGKFMLYFPGPRHLSSKELQLASLIATQVAFAVSGMRARITAQQSEARRLEVLETSTRTAQQLAAIVESSDDAILSKDLNGIIASWNRGAERMFGYTPGEAIGQSILLIIPPERVDEETMLLDRIRNGQHVQMETVRRHKNGADVHISLTVSPVRNAQDQIVGAAKIARDITVRKRYEAELAALYQQQRLQSEAAEAARRQAAFIAHVAEALSRSLDYVETLTAVAQLAVPEVADWCAIDIVEESGEVRRLAVAHVDPAKVQYARELQERYPADPKASGGVHEVIRTGSPVLVRSISPELLAQHVPDAERLRIVQSLGLSSYMCVPIVSPGGVLGAMTFVLAESGRHYSETDLTFAQDLAGRAALAIDNALAYQRADSANRLKDEFLATLSHELRTPLNAILGYAQMLNLGALKEDGRSRALAVLTRNADSLRQIIDDVLDVSRITSGKLRLAVRPVDLNDILPNAMATMQPAADAKGVSLKLRVASGLPVIPGDPDRLQQIVWNLLSNAVKFTARGGHVRLSAERGDEFVEIVVQDDGQGIDPRFVPHLFERFRQADSRFSREHGGLGLGLAIVRDLVELHGGSVSASSAGLGLGATFRVLLPSTGMSREIRPAANDLGRVVPALTEGGLTTRLKHARILAVDDQEDARDLLRLILENAGAQVTTASSAAEALELLRRSPYNALIADLGMPQMDGMEMIRRVRQTLPAPANETPAAALTAYARSDDRIGAVASGFQMHLAKPVNPTELVIAIGLLIGR
jgi:PAS domain S-box-containing protein